MLFNCGSQLRDRRSTIGTIVSLVVPFFDSITRLYFFSNENNMPRENSPEFDGTRVAELKSTLALLGDIAAERQYQVQKWGNDFDDDNTINDWSAYITKYNGNAAFADDKDDQRKQMVKVATLAIAALEAFDRNDGFPERHYDGCGLAEPNEGDCGPDDSADSVG